MLCLRIPPAANRLLALAVEANRGEDVVSQRQRGLIRGREWWAGRELSHYPMIGLNPLIILEILLSTHLQTLNTWIWCIALFITNAQRSSSSSLQRVQLQKTLIPTFSQRLMCSKQQQDKWSWLFMWWKTLQATSQLQASAHVVVILLLQSFLHVVMWLHKHNSWGTAT